MDGKRDDYVNRLKAKLDDWNADIDRLEARLGDLAETARQECKEQIAQLRARRQDCETRVHGLSEAAAEAWEDMKAGLDVAAEALGSAIKAARERFGSSASAGSK